MSDRHAEENTEQSTCKAEHHGFGQELCEDIAFASTHGFTQTDLARPFGDRDEHDVHDPDPTDDERDRGDPAEQQGERAADRGRGLQQLGLVEDREVVGVTCADPVTDPQQLRDRVPRRLHLDAAAKSGGNVLARARDAAAVQVDEGALVSGKTETRLLPKEKSRYTRVRFYVWKAIWLAAAFLVGLALHALLPGLFPARLAAGATLLRAAGLGFVALVVVPAAALLLMITLIGLPAGLLVLGLWLAGLYLAQILVATLIGRGFLQRADSPPASMAPVLLVGLVCVAVSVNLPYVGGLLRFVVLVLGLGLAVIGAHRGARRGVEA